MEWILIFVDRESRLFNRFTTDNNEITAILHGLSRNRDIGQIWLGKGKT